MIEHVFFRRGARLLLELNDELETADPLELGVTKHGSTIDYYDDDFYRLSTPSDGTLQLRLGNEQHSSGGWSVYLRDAGGNTIDSYDFSATGTSHVGTRIGLPAGAYTIEVSPYGSCEGHVYELTADFVAASDWETDELNDELETADPLELGVTKHGSTIDYYDDDFYRLTLSKTTTVQIEFNNAQSSSGRWNVYLRDMNNDTLIRAEFYAEATHHMSARAVLKAGTYTVEVSPSSANGYTYDFRVFEPGPAVTMHRLYNQWTGEHFYTSDSGERDRLTAVGWTYEGVGWTAPAEGDEVYRLYNPYVSGGDHHYTLDVAERDALVSLGWNDEGVGWFSSSVDGEGIEGSVPLYRQYNPYATTGTHNYTTSEEENNALVRAGWEEEGTAWYGISDR